MTDPKVRAPNPATVAQILADPDAERPAFGGGGDANVPSVPPFGPGGAGQPAPQLQKHKRRVSGLRSLEYRRGGTRFQRCSRCHVERDMSAPILRDGLDQVISPESTMSAVMVGQDLLGFICNGCFHATAKHIVQLFPNEQGFPYVDKRGQLLPPPRCNDCGTLLAFADDGIHVLCPQCDVAGATCG